MSILPIREPLKTPRSGAKLQGAMGANEPEIELREGPLVVRSWRASDAPDLAVQANDRRVWLGLRDAFPHPYTVEDGTRFIEAALRRLPPSFFAIEAEGRVAGGIGYTLRSDVERIGAEVGYWLGHAFWGRGLATAALRLVTRHAFAAHYELRRLYALPYATNQASARVLTKAGYRLEGTLRQSVLKDGHVLDQWMYAILRDELPGPEVASRARPAPPGRV